MVGPRTSTPSHIWTAALRTAKFVVVACAVFLLGSLMRSVIPSFLPEPQIVTSPANNSMNVESQSVLPGRPPDPAPPYLWSRELATLKEQLQAEQLAGASARRVQVTRRAIEKLEARIASAETEYQREVQKRRQEYDQAVCVHKLRGRGVVVQAGPCIDLDRLIDSLDAGQYTFNKPKHGYVDESFPVVLVLTTSPDQDAAIALAEAPGLRVSAQARFAQHVEAELRGADMRVDPPGPQIRTATTTAPVAWRWAVTPLKEGYKFFGIEVYAGIKIGNENPTRVLVKSFSEAVQIQLTAFQRLKMYLTETSTVIIGVAAAFAGVVATFDKFSPWRRALFRFLFLRRKGEPEQGDVTKS